MLFVGFVLVSDSRGCAWLGRSCSFSSFPVWGVGVGSRGRFAAPRGAAAAGPRFIPASLSVQNRSQLPLPKTSLIYLQIFTVHFANSFFVRSTQFSFRTVCPFGFGIIQVFLSVVTRRDVSGDRWSGDMWDQMGLAPRIRDPKSL
jgi:hypothetical protein